MYNLTTKITELSRDLDPNKQNKLTAMKVDAKEVLSLTSVHRKTKTAGTTQMRTIQEEHEGEGGPQDEDHLGLFEAEDIQNVLRHMNYKIEYILWGVRVPALIGTQTNMCIVASRSCDDREQEG